MSWQLHSVPDVLSCACRALPDACLQSLPEEIGQLAGLETL